MGAGGFARLASGTSSGVWQCLSGLVALAAFGTALKRSTWRNSSKPPSLLTFPPPKSAPIFLPPKPGIQTQVGYIPSLAKSPVTSCVSDSIVTGTLKDFATFLHLWCNFRASRALQDLFGAKCDLFAI